jgi:hypothetical protein
MMTQTGVNQQTTAKTPVPNFNQAQHPIQPQKQLTEENIKEVIIETLIQLDLIPLAQKKKAITLE